ncbi:MAG: ABC transporter permease, partial [Sphingopyxis sp.]|nr:ABC transporter permease [Sphingopyxis sp.]
MAEQDWNPSKRTFAAVSLPTLLWVVVFFLVPMAIVWLYSFGENRGLTEIEFSGTLDNYKRATEWLYLGIFGKSFAV